MPVVNEYNLREMLNESCTHLPSVQLVFEEEAEVRELIRRKGPIDGEHLLEGITNNFEA
jgi:hypothetical protein